MSEQTADFVPVRKAKIKTNYETVAWKWMRYSGVLLIPLVWIHVLLQDVLTGVHRINLDYVAARWANMGWRLFDAALISFAFAHGMNGVRQVLDDYIESEPLRKTIAWVLLAIWFIITLIGGIALVGGVR